MLPILFLNRQLPVAPMVGTLVEAEGVPARAPVHVLDVLVPVLVAADSTEVERDFTQLS